MGSTGRSPYGSQGNKRPADETFGIKDAVVYKGKIPTGKGLEPVGPNKITLKAPYGAKDSIIFQFKLSKNGSLMTITGYKNGVPEVRCKVAVDSGQPSLDKVIASGTKHEVLQAIKMKDLFQKSTNIKENQLGAIANELIQKKAVKGGA